MEEVIDLSTVDWKRTREELTTNVFGKSLIPKEWSNVKVVLTTVKPGGEFKKHKDSYHHVFYFIKGEGLGFLGDKEYQIKPELKVLVPAGINHAYKNTGKEEMLLLTINIPEKK